MNPLKKANKKILRAKLLMKGLTLKSFSTKHGFNPQTVKVVVHRFCGKEKDARIGSVSSRVLDALKNETRRS